MPFQLDTSVYNKLAPLQVDMPMDIAAKSEDIKASRMKNALMQQHMDEENSPEAQQDRQLQKRQQFHNEAVKTIKETIPALNESNWSEFGKFMQDNYGEGGIFLQPYDAAVHEKMLQNFGYTKPKNENSPFIFMNTPEGVFRADKKTGFGELVYDDSQDNQHKKPIGASDRSQKFTQDQTNAATFGARAETADKILSDLGDNYSVGGVWAKDKFGILANPLISDNSQRASQAQEDFLRAILRKESGATISSEEISGGKSQYFPQPGDSDIVKKQKAQNRQIAIQGLINAAGPAAFEPKTNSDVMGQKTMSIEKLKATAQKNGWTIDQAMEMAKRHGYTVQ